MKKIGKKLSFLTKIMLVVGLLISNLSSLSVVFAYENPDDVVITLEEDTLTIKYTDLLSEEVEKVRVDVYESYTYLDGTSDTLDVVEYELDDTQIESAKLGELELTHAKSVFKLFDGTYKVEVKFYELVQVLPEVIPEGETLESLTPEVNEELIAVGTYTKEVTYDSGLLLKVYNDSEVELNLSNGKYSLTTEEKTVRVDAYVLAGGLAPSDTFMYEEVSYTAEELLGVAFSNEYNFDGKLYGEYGYQYSLELLKLVVSEELEGSDTPEYTTVTYSTDVRFMYGTYADNADVLNSVNTNDAYYFVGNVTNGILYNYVDLTLGTNGTMLDLYNVLKDATIDSEVEYKLFKGGLDLIQEYNNVYGTQVDPVSEEEVTLPEVSLEEYLEEITVDGTVKLTLTSGEVTVSYDLVVLGDVNGDNSVDTTDVDTLIELIVAGNTNVNADVDGNGVVNGKDVLYLQSVLENSDWNVTVVTEDAVLDSELTTNLGEETLVSGDEFTVDYTLKLSENEVSGFSGQFNYDKESLELVSVETMNGVNGSYDKETGKFFYVGNESLALPEVEEIEQEENTDEVMLTSEETTPIVNTSDYVVLSATFKVLKSGTYSVSVKNKEYFNLNTYLNVATVESTVSVEVAQSDDNTLSYLEVAGVVIELVEGVFEYEVTVKNEVTLVDLKYILSNVAASVTSTIYPEELAVGANEVTITVLSESGLEQNYKVVVTREEAPKETTTKVNYNNYQNDDNNKEEEVVTPVTPEEPVEEKESNLSKIIIMILIVLVIGGLVYLIFKDDEEDDTNKNINKLKDEDADLDVKPTKKVETTKKANPQKKSNTTKSGNKNSNAKKKTNSKKN